MSNSDFWNQEFSASEEEVPPVEEELEFEDASNMKVQQDEDGVPSVTSETSSPKMDISEFVDAETIASLPEVTVQSLETQSTSALWEVEDFAEPDELEEDPALMVKPDEDMIYDTARPSLTDEESEAEIEAVSLISQGMNGDNAVEMDNRAADVADVASPEVNAPLEETVAENIPPHALELAHLMLMADTSVDKVYDPNAKNPIHKLSYPQLCAGAELLSVKKDKSEAELNLEPLLQNEISRRCNELAYQINMSVTSNDAKSLKLASRVFSKMKSPVTAMKSVLAKNTGSNVMSDDSVQNGKKNIISFINEAYKSAVLRFRKFFDKKSVGYSSGISEQKPRPVFQFAQMLGAGAVSALLVLGATGGLNNAKVEVASLPANIETAVTTIAQNVELKSASVTLEKTTGNAMAVSADQGLEQGLSTSLRPKPRPHILPSAEDATTPRSENPAFNEEMSNFDSGYGRGDRIYMPSSNFVHHAIREFSEYYAGDTEYATSVFQEVIREYYVRAQQCQMYGEVNCKVGLQPMYPMTHPEAERSNNPYVDQFRGLIELDAGANAFRLFDPNGNLVLVEAPELAPMNPVMEPAYNNMQSGYSR